MKKIGISTDRMCDLPEDYLAENNINAMQFYIHTSTGRFWNETEITSDNIVEYLEGGNEVLRTNVPEPEECRAYLADLLTRYDEVIHITTSDKVGLSYPIAKTALALLGKKADRVTLINSAGISAGLGHMVMLAAALRDRGSSAAEIARACEAMRNKISSTFILPNADCLYRVGYTSQGIRNLCRVLKIRPVLCTKKGKLSLKGFQIGNYEKAVARFIRGELRGGRRIDRNQLFITHAGCSPKHLTRIRGRVDKLYKFDHVTVTKASAFITSSFGPETVGLLYVRR